MNPEDGLKILKFDEIFFFFYWFFSVITETTSNKIDFTCLDFTIEHCLILRTGTYDYK